MTTLAATTRLFAEAAQSSVIVKAQQSANRIARGGARRTAAAKSSCGGVDLCARQFRPCRDLRQIFDRDAARHSGRVAGSVAGLGLRCCPRGRQARCAWQYRSRGAARTVGQHGGREGSGGGDGRAGQCHRFAARRARRPRLAAVRRAGDERGRDQELYLPRSRRCIDLVAAWSGRRRPCECGLARRPGSSRGRGTPTGRRWSSAAGTQPACT